MSGLAPASTRFGDQTPFCEPAWYQGYHSPYYDESHRALRAVAREFTDKEVAPIVDRCVREKRYPPELHRRAYELGLASAMYPPQFGGTPPRGAAKADAFHELVIVDELARVMGGGVLGQLAINSMALPPLIQYGMGDTQLRDAIVKSVVRGDKHICLAISEPTAGSDVANIRATAQRNGDHYIVSGQKKWITGGTMASWFTTAVRTGGDGFGGISLIVVPADAPGVRVRRMETQFDNAHSTTFVTFDDVKVPVGNLIGGENAGALVLLQNFNHERFVISVATCRDARNCYSEAFKWAMKRKTFNKRLVSHQIIRMKLAVMAQRIEALHAQLEAVAYQFKMGVSDSVMGGACALLKVNASQTFEFCAREASQIFGGAAIVKEGQGKRVERMYRSVRAAAIPGGSEEILQDYAIRAAVAKTDRMRAKL